MKRQLPFIYRESQTTRLQGQFAPIDVYVAGLNTFVVVSTDILIVNRRRRVVYLATRIIKPMKGWWWIGGRMLKGKSPEESVIRKFRLETGLDLEVERFQYVRDIRSWWDEREQPPQEAGVDFLTHVFIVELSDEELRHAAEHLDPNEYDTRIGLVEFNREQLSREAVNQAVVDTHDIIFASRWQKVRVALRELLNAIFCK